MTESTAGFIVALGLFAALLLSVHDIHKRDRKAYFEGMARHQTQKSPERADAAAR
jgi:hypothetical protein